MVSFRTKNPNLGKFWRVLQWKILVYFMAIWSTFQPFDIFHGLWVYFPPFWYILPVLVCCTKKNLATLDPCGEKITTKRALGLVALSPPTDEETGTMGREIESRWGIEGSFFKNKYKK
jgi:hypothetical protein